MLSFFYPLFARKCHVHSFVHSFSATLHPVSLGSCQAAASAWREWVTSDRRAFVARLNVALLEATLAEHCLVASSPLANSSLAAVLGHATLSPQDARKVALEALKVREGAQRGAGGQRANRPKARESENERLRERASL
jgi:hypothetical protein